MSRRSGEGAPPCSKTVVCPLLFSYYSDAQWYVRQAGPAVAQLFRNEMCTMLDLLAGQPAIGARTVDGARFMESA
jgi:hypothetical protein